MKIKSLIAGLVTGIILTAQTGVTFAAETDYFSDVTPERADYNAITFMADMDLIEGYDDGTFKPDQEVNRAEALKMIMGMENMNYWQQSLGGLFSEDNRKMVMSDLDTEAWYYPYVLEAYNNWLVDGYPDGTFKPEQTVNTAEAVKILLNHTFLRVDNRFDIKVTANPFKDANMNAWYAPYMQYAKDRGIAVADAEGNINPGSDITRGSLAQLIYRAYAFDGQTADKKGVTVELDAVAGKYIVKNLGKEVARLDMIHSMNGEEEAYIEKVTDRYAYVSVCATGFGGYIWYRFCNGNTYAIDLAQGGAEDISFVDETEVEKSHQNFMDANLDEESPVGQLYAWTSKWETHKIFVTSAGRGYDMKTFMVPEKYGQYGDVTFSPDGKKLAYAAIVGNPENEESAVYTIDIETGEQTLVKEVTKQIMGVNGWNPDGTLNYSVVTQN